MANFHDKPNIFVNHIALKVIEINRSIKFYTDIMGFSLLRKEKGIATLTADGFNPIMTLIQPNNVIPKIPRRTGLYHLAVLLPSRYHLGLFIKNIGDEDYPIIGGSNHGVSEAIYLEDIDGNGIEVYRDIDENEWNRKGDKISMISEALNFAEIIKETGEDKWKNAPLSTIIGHIHLHVGDLDRARKFYIDGLGFDLTMEAGSSAIFLSTGGYHHHISLNIWNGRNAEAPLDNSVGLKYYTLQFPNEEARGKTIMNLKKLGYKVIIKDGNYYTKDPSSNLIELKA